MDTSDQYSITSNVPKMYKHLDKLKMIQDYFNEPYGVKGHISPVMIHFIPTHNCQLKCVHCCFKNRGAADDISIEVTEEAMYQFNSLGVKAIELSGGGEPTKWKHLDYFMNNWSSQFKVGIITNGVDVLKNQERYEWVRVSLNPIDYGITPNLPDSDKTFVSTCYIWNKNSKKHIDEVGKFCKDNDIICRVAPDCIQDLELIEADMGEIDAYIEDHENLFLSDFNINLNRANHRCYMSLWKPCFYLDGNVYACPSSELSVENEKQMSDKFKVCSYEDIYEYYTGKAEITEHDCSYCKYSDQNKVIDDVLMDLNHIDFA